jgi:hypothetical protein
MSNLTNYSENQLLVWQLTDGAVTRPTARYIGLGANHSETGLTGEPTGNGYARQICGFTASGSSATNTAQVVFGPCVSTGWGTLTSLGIFDAVSGGNCLWSGPLSASISVGIGDSYAIPAGALTASFD